MLKRSRLSAALFPLAVSISALMLVAACGGAAATPAVTPAATAAPTGDDPTPVVATASPTVMAGIVHPTGPTDLVLRYDVAGGFVPPEFFAAHVPAFTLYGDGTVVFVDNNTPLPQRQDNIGVASPLRTTKLAEADIQALLEFALRDSGLAVAKTQYDNQMVADAPSTIFTVNAEGDSKTVSAYALGMDAGPGTVPADAAILKALGGLADRLSNFGTTVSSEPYTPAAYRAVILEQSGITGVVIRDWPWIDPQPSDFATPADPNALQQGTHVLQSLDLSALGIDGVQNGIYGGLWVKATGGKVYSLVIRPLLPDEKA